MMRNGRAVSGGVALIRFVGLFYPNLALESGFGDEPNGCRGG